MARATGSFVVRTRDGSGAVVALLGGVALAAASLVVLFGLAQLAQLLNALPRYGSPIF